MASLVFVVDSSFKRTTIKVTPGRFLRDILEEACSTRRLEPNNHALKTQNGKLLDLSQPFRLSGLGPGAKLQLTQASRSAGVVNVAVQLPASEAGGARLSDKFPSTTSLWLILRKFEDGVAGAKQKLNLTQRAAPSGSEGAGRLLYEQPCINLMGRQLEGFEDLQKTLSQLGVSGSVMMRLEFRVSQQPLEEAMREMEEYFKSQQSLDTVPAGVGSSAAQGPPRVEDAPIGNGDVEAESDPTPMDTDTDAEVPLEPPSLATKDALPEDTPTEDGRHGPQPSEPPTPPSNTLNGISVFLPPTSDTPAAALAPDDPTAFDPLIEHAKSHQAALTRASRNTRLLSDKELEEQETERQAKLALVQNITVRVRYPDQSLIETSLTSSATAADLYEKVRSTLQAADEQFELRYFGSKGQQSLPNSASHRLVKDSGFRGKVLVTLAWASEAGDHARKGPSLKEEYRSRATELKVELVAQQAESEAVEEKAKEVADKGKGKGKAGGDVEARMKKLLAKMGRK